jgi:hypothetical protein
MVPKCGHLLIILAYEFADDDLQSAFEGMGQLSLDENQEASIYLSNPTWD